jgi:hypothetical protein
MTPLVMEDSMRMSLSKKWASGTLSHDVDVCNGCNDKSTICHPTLERWSSIHSVGVAPIQDLIYSFPVGPLTLTSAS